MSASRDEILDAALQLSEADRWIIANRLLDTLPDSMPGLSEDAPELFEELQRRAEDTSTPIPLSELWPQD